MDHLERLRAWLDDWYAQGFEKRPGETWHELAQTQAETARQRAHKEAIQRRLALIKTQVDVETGRPFDHDLHA